MEKTEVGRSVFDEQFGSAHEEVEMLLDCEDCERAVGGRA